MKKTTTHQIEVGGLIDLKNIIGSICKNPHMYTLNGTFEEASAWLVGFAEGVKYSDHDLYSQWLDFEEWVQIQLGYSPVKSWEYTIRQFNLHDKDAFEQLNSLLLEYVASKNYS